MKHLIILLALSITHLTIAQVSKNTNFDNYPPGTIITNQIDDIVISAVNNIGPDIAMIFDSDNPNPTGDDPDLQVFRGHILIISEDGDPSDPDDASGGGLLIFEFSTPKFLDTLTLIDMETSGSWIRAYDQLGNLLLNIPVPLGEDCACVHVDLYQDYVSRLEVEFSGSGAIDDFNYTDTPLSIDLKSFTGKDQNGLHILEWKTTNSVNFSHFQVEYSLDAMHWTTIGKVDGGNDVNSFEYVPTPGMNYYRLLLVNEDGTTMHSPIVTLRSDYDLFSNPALQNQIKVYDILGRRLQRGDNYAGILMVEFRGKLYKRANLRNW